MNPPPPQRNACPAVWAGFKPALAAPEGNAANQVVASGIVEPPFRLD